MKAKNRSWQTNKESRPVVFIHYGDSPYLKYVIRCVKLTNPSKQVFFLGDESNRYLEKFGVRHIQFSQYLNSTRIQDFGKVFRIVAGKDHKFNKRQGTDFWLKFVFLRWFIIYEFIVKEGVSSFWIFDSDNLILKDLSIIEKDLLDYDCTSQCNGMCMNGLVNNQTTVSGYLDIILELFRDKEFLDRQQAEFDSKHPDYAFTEMRAFQEYVIRRNISVKWLGEPNGDYIFCDSLVQSVDSTYNTSSYYGVKIKTVYYLKEAIAFKKDEFLYPYNLNLSWLDDFIFRLIFMERFLSQKKPVLRRLLRPLFEFMDNGDEVANLRRTHLQRLLLRILYIIYK